MDDDDGWLTRREAPIGFRLTGDFGLTSAGLSSSAATTAAALAGLLVVVGLRLRFGAKWINLSIRFYRIVKKRI